MADSSDDGFAFIAVIGALVMAYFAIAYWYVVIMGLALLVVIYGHYLGSIYGKKRIYWRNRFQAGGSIIFVAAFAIAAFLTASITTNNLPNLARFAVVMLIGAHVFGWVLKMFLDMLWRFLNLPDPSASKRQHQQEKNNRQKETPKSKFSSSVTTEKEALEILEMKKPFTAAQLKKRRMELLKKIHPDTGGSNMMTRMVNEAYELLKTRV